jgi:hypothetical protein
MASYVYTFRIICSYSHQGAFVPSFVTVLALIKVAILYSIDSVTSHNIRMLKPKAPNLKQLMKDDAPLAVNNIYE